MTARWTNLYRSADRRRELLSLICAERRGVPPKDTRRKLQDNKFYGLGLLIDCFRRRLDQGNSKVDTAWDCKASGCGPDCTGKRVPRLLQRSPHKRGISRVIRH